MQIQLTLEPSLVLFYTRIALSAGKPLEQVLAEVGPENSLACVCDVSNREEVENCVSISPLSLT